MNIADLSAVGLGQKIATKELSSREVTEHYLAQIEHSDKTINAFTNLADKALDAAQSVDQKISSGETLSPLAGVPVSIKDVLCTAEFPTTCGSRMLENFRPPYTATAVRKLLEADLVFVGKTNMDEFAMGGSTESSYFGVTRNPWDPERTPGGSSGGAAASVAAGMVPLAIGSDTGGSVRQPAAFCGVCGLKPTYGRISRYGLVAFASSLDQVGPLAHSIEDLAASLGVMAGHDCRDSTSLNEPVPDYVGGLDKSISGLKVGIIREHLENESLDDSVRDSVIRGSEALKELGAELVDVHLPHTEYSVPAYYVVAPSEASGNLSRYDGVHYGFRELAASSEDSPLDAMIAHSRSQGFGAEVKRRIMLGTFALSSGYYDAYYKKALQVRRLIAQDYQQAFAEVDVLLGPVTPTPAFGLGERLDDPIQMYLGDLFTVGANLAGIPALSLPAGLTDAKLPLAIQLQGPALGEGTLLNVAHQLQVAQFFEPQIAPSSQAV